jgi:hypothetical protein
MHFLCHYPSSYKGWSNYFQLNKDTGEDLQAAYIKEITDAENVYKFFGEMGTSDVGISFFVNEKGLAGSARCCRS